MSDSLYHQMIELDEFINAIPEDCNEQEYIEEFDAIMQRIESKVDSCSDYLDFISGRIEELSKKKDRLDKAIKSYKSKQKRMQSYLVNCIQLSGENELIGSNTKISIRNNPVSLKTDFKPDSKSYKEVDPMLLPLELKPYIKEKLIYVLDSTKLKNAVMAEPDHFKSARLESTKTINVRGI